MYHSLKLVVIWMAVVMAVLAYDVGAAHLRAAARPGSNPGTTMAAAPQERRRKLSQELLLSYEPYTTVMDQVREGSLRLFASPVKYCTN